MSRLSATTLAVRASIEEIEHTLVEALHLLFDLEQFIPVNGFSGGCHGQYSEKGDIGWGNQIRSYVFQPYQMVKDLRTGVESGNIQDVMDGNLDPFIEAMLRGHKRER